MTNRSTEFVNNDTDQQTRRQVLKDTYLSRAQAEAETAMGGRFKKLTPTHVTGIPEYPRQSSGPWSTPDLTGEEPPLGYSIDELPDFGDAAPASSPCAVEQASPTCVEGLSRSSDNPSTPFLRRF